MLYIECWNALRQNTFVKVSRKDIYEPRFGVITRVGKERLKVNLGREDLLILENEWDVWQFANLCEFCTAVNDTIRVRELDIATIRRDLETASRNR